MPKPTKPRHPLIRLLKASTRPIYAVDARRRIIYCNEALEAWLELSADRIVGRLVEYHSEPSAERAKSRSAAGPLAGLCPPPAALAGEACTSTVSCVLQDGRLVYRHAEFIPLHLAESPSTKTRRREVSKIRTAKKQASGAVLIVLADANLSANELDSDPSTNSSADDLHRTIRRFRRAQGDRYGLASILGTSSAMRKVRSQIVAVAASDANALIHGRPGTGRASIARAIHYHAVGDATVKLLPIDGATLTDDSLRRALDAVNNSATGATRRPTLLIENAERISLPHQAILVEAIRRNAVGARIIATTREQQDGADESYSDDADESDHGHTIAPALRDVISTITIDVPRLIDRLDDLPLVAQFFLEAANRGNPQQRGSLRPDALDLLSLYTWPGELDELRDVIAVAHAAATNHTITPADLPAVIQHAAKAAALKRPPRERIALNELLTTIEKEAIVRALAQAGGNKSEAAESLGLTRPRLYRRMEQLGLAPPEPSEATPKFKELPLPDFRELPSEEQTS